MTINLTQGLHRSVQRNPQGLATVFQGRRQTFATLADRVARLATALRAAGMETGDRIGMLAMNSDRYLEYYFAVPWGGGIVNPCNIRWSAAEVAYSLDDCDTRILIVDDTFLAMAADLKVRSKSLKLLIHAGDGPTPEGMLSYEAILAAAEPMPDMRRAGDDVMGVFYTGGTTGFPKGVALTHGSIFASSLALTADLAWPQAAIYLHAAPMFHMADTAFGFAQVIRGGAHVIIPSFTPQGVLQALQDEKVTTVLLVPTMIQMTFDHPDVAKYDLSALGTVIYGASPISEAVLKRAMAAVPAAGFVQAYGMTELSPVATVLTTEWHVLEGARAGRLRAAGRAALCCEVRIVDTEGNEVPRGTVGEVAVRGPNVMQGYWNQPELTANAVRDGWMHTGDGAYMDDEGFIYVVDRMKDMIVSGGENVYSAEVENALMQHRGVAMCAVIAVPDPKWGERVHAVIVKRAGVAVAEDELVAHCRELIAGYKCPRSVEFRDALPISGAGKILKAQLRDPYWADAARKVN